MPIFVKSLTGIADEHIGVFKLARYDGSTSPPAGRLSAPCLLYKVQA
jgi:hypothetical protein